ncbi:hypothetical protein Tco_1556514 [Tanacetum coccineum]
MFALLPDSSSAVPSLLHNVDELYDIHLLTIYGSDLLILLAYAPSMPPLLSLPLSMACDDSDGCGCLALFVIKIAFDKIPLRCDIDDEIVIVAAYSHDLCLNDSDKARLSICVVAGQVSYTRSHVTVNEAVMNWTLTRVCRGIKSLLGMTIFPINNKGIILVMSIVKGYVQNEPANKTLWLDYTYSMPPILSLSLSMACDDSDGCRWQRVKSMWSVVECDPMVVGRNRGKAVCILAWQLTKVAAMADVFCFSDGLPF